MTSDATNMAVRVNKLVDMKIIEVPHFKTEVNLNFEAIEATLSILRPSGPHRLLKY